MGCVTVALSSTGQSTAHLGGTLRMNAVNGVATFNDLTIDAPGVFTLPFFSDGVASAPMPANQGTVVTDAAPATHLVFSMQPANVVKHSTLRVDVSAEDNLGNVDALFTGAITLSLGNNPGPLVAPAGGGG